MSEASQSILIDIPDYPSKRRRRRHKKSRRPSPDYYFKAMPHKDIAMLDMGDSAASSPDRTTQR